ncbi:MAG TPA: DNA primase [Chthoniobacteraceae bacterium]|jgi:DNA primase|nr:DNA primase [Chthoniobacteraceae bacterium]
MISPETIEQIAAANDIVDVIGGYFPLKRAGTAFKALCPFHQEKSPSFTVNPQRQRFHCFGCGEGGDVFAFVGKYENVDFITAARRLAERAGIPIVEEARSPDEDRARTLRRRLLALHQEVTEWFHQILMTGPQGKGARNYLRNRGLTGEVARQWKIGYAPDEWEAFGEWATGKGYKREEIVQSGLVSLRDAENPDSDYYDRFRDRVMFPICNDLGEVIGFSGRVLASDAQAAKYVNSPETPLFKKGEILFGLHKSKRALVDKKSAIVLEGQIDLITAFEAGVQNVVAPQGTAFTDKQARILKRYAEEVVLCFDADTAGRKAAVRSLPALLGLDLGVRVVELPQGDDPDSLIRTQGPEAFVERVAAARDFFDYQLDIHAADPDFATPRGKVKVAHELAAMVQLINDRLLREAVAGRVATRLAMQLSEFWAAVTRSARNSQAGQASRQAEPASPAAVQPLAATGPIAMLTLLALGDPGMRTWIHNQPWSARLLEMEETELLVKILDSDLTPGDPASVAAFSAGLDESSQTLLDRLLRERLPEDRVAMGRDCWRAIEKRDLLRRKEGLLARMREPNISPGEIVEIQKQILDLQKLITDISRPLSPSGPE